MAVSREGGSPLETNWIAERSLLRHLLTLHPTWSSAEVARCLGRSESWVKKWRKRFNEAPPHDQQVLRSHSRARSPQRISSECQDRARCSMTSHVRARVCLKTFICHARRRRNGAILRQHDRIAVDRRRACKPRELPEPLQEIQIDFKDDSTVPADPLGKQKPGGGNLSFCRCRHFHLASCRGSRGFHGGNG